MSERIEHELASLAIRHEDDMRDVRRTVAMLRETITEGSKHRVVPFPSQSREIQTLQRQVSELQTTVGKMLGLIEQLNDELETCGHSR